MLKSDVLIIDVSLKHCLISAMVDILNDAMLLSVAPVGSCEPPARLGTCGNC